MKHDLLVVVIIFTLATMACSGQYVTVKDSAATQGKALVSTTMTQTMLNQLGGSLDVKYRLLTNFPKSCSTTGVDGRCFSAQIELTSDVDLMSSDWAIYFSLMRPVRNVFSTEFTIQRVQGDLHKIIPTALFTGLKQGQTKKIGFLGEFWQLSEIDAMPNYYLVSGDLLPALIKSTVVTRDPETGMEIRPYVIAFSDAEKHYKRSDRDVIKWATADVIFQANQEINLQTHSAINTIIPTPNKVDITSDNKPVSLYSGIKLELNGHKKAPIAAALLRLKRIGVRENKEGISIVFSSWLIQVKQALIS